MNNPILYIVLNGSLKMSPGKAAAQAVHSAMMLEGIYWGRFSKCYKRTVVVLEAKNAETIKNLRDYLDDAGLISYYYIDERSEGEWDEQELFQATALAVEPIEHEDKEKREIFSDFPLFGYKKDIWSRIEARFHK